MTRAFCILIIIIGALIAVIGGGSGFLLASFAIIYPDGGGAEKLFYLVIGALPALAGIGLIYAGARTLRHRSEYDT